MINYISTLQQSDNQAEFKFDPSNKKKKEEGKKAENCILFYLIMMS